MSLSAVPVVVLVAFREFDEENTGIMSLDELALVLRKIAPAETAVIETLIEEERKCHSDVEYEPFLVKLFEAKAKQTGKPTAARAQTRGLTSSNIYVRIRPIAASSGHVAGEPVSKKLEQWDGNSLTIQDDDRGQKTTFEVSRVLPPEFEQDQVFAEVAPELEAFKQDTNVLFFAYGQTGSGKTHTMLGEIESLASAEPVPGWGLFPRIVHSTLESMKEWRESGVHSALMASAVEFYLGAGFDLNSDPNSKTEVDIDRDGNIFGVRSKEITSTRQLKKWIMRMYSNRTTATTKMNDASSRSHCAFILTLHKKLADDTYLKTRFSLIDMAGSERASKTGGERMGGNAIILELKKLMEAGTPEKLSIGAQGTLINLELTNIATELLKASECHEKGMPYKAQKANATAAQLYFCACCDGQARMGAVVTVSQSPQHGFETWFSLRYAEQLAACRVPLKRVKPQPMDRVLEQAATAAEAASEKFADWDGRQPQSVNQWKCFVSQSGAVTNSSETLDLLHRLAEGAPPEAEEEGGSDLEWPPPPATQPRRAKRAGPLKKSALEMGKTNDNFSVFIRVRPLLDRETRAGSKNCFIITDIDFPTEPPPQRITVQGADAVKSSYVFNRVFDDSYGQHDVYQASVQRYVADFLGGTNVTIFAYGQTGTGKTHTISGPSDDPGVMSRILSDVLAGLGASGKELYYEYVQIYIDEIMDLLVEGGRSDLKPMERRDGGVFLQNITSHRAVSAEKILKDVEAGGKRRATRGHDMNAVSSRSHAVLMLRLVEPGEEASQAVASMFVVDLAGSERVDRSGVTGKAFDEAVAINSSLLCLGRVVLTLIENQNSGSSFVPYKESALTYILKAGIGGNSKTALIACVTQAADSMSESVNTLRFAMQASHVKNKVEKKEAKDAAGAAAARIAEKGHTLTLADGQTTVNLSTGPMELHGHWTGSGDKVVVLLPGLKREPVTLKDLSDALAAKGCEVLVPKLPGNAEKELDADMDALIALFDWLGVAQPVVYGHDWGAIRACKFKLLHPKRVKFVVLENRNGKMDEKESKEAMRKGDMSVFGGAFQWFFDGAFPSQKDPPPGKNMKGWKWKTDFLWPCHNNGKPDTRKTGMMSKLGTWYVRIAKGNMIDSFTLNDNDIATLIASHCKG
eukprot:TRINITY_DN15488_c0_g1_i1.p1 TRINITY_DN15488_c0_g1~~TRINITY_DN15488_c0_g1_i1.p1  ORF type:complete len:1146 (+),score=209.29 TRINITY_DN15488_c0_g1_i1:69-3506(+)